MKRISYYRQDSASRMHLRIQSTLLRDIKRAAKRNGISASAYVKQAAIEKLEREEA